MGFGKDRTGQSYNIISFVGMHEQHGLAQGVVVFVSIFMVGKWHTDQAQIKGRN